MRRITFLIAMLLTACVFAQSPKKVAVYVTGDIEESYKKVVGSKIVSGIIDGGKYTAVERTTDFLDALSKETDYQMSGAVNDKQIVKLGAQFGVRYVVVADMSEVFESVFISARMIDVQTGMITISSEAEQEINSAKDLITLAESIVSSLDLGISADFKILGPFDSSEQLFQIKIPEGYRACTAKEIERCIKSNKKLMFPIIAEFKLDLSSKENYTIRTIDYTRTYSGLQFDNKLSAPKRIRGYDEWSELMPGSTAKLLDRMSPAKINPAVYIYLLPSK